MKSISVLGKPHVRAQPSLGTKAKTTIHKAVEYLVALMLGLNKAACALWWCFWVVSGLFCEVWFFFFSVFSFVVVVIGFFGFVIFFFFPPALSVALCHSVFFLIYAPLLDRLALCDML